VQLLKTCSAIEGNPTPIEVKIFGDDQAQLEASPRISKDGWLTSMKSGIVDVIGVERGGPESPGSHPIAAAQMGLMVEQVADQLSAPGSAKKRRRCGCSIAPFRRRAIPTRSAQRLS
jgi:hypothetical protein